MTHSKMLQILALDPDASLRLSPYTGQWYIAANIEIGDGAILSGVVEHRDLPHEAVDAFFGRVSHTGLNEYVVSTYCGQRREWSWNGAAFAEVTRTDAVRRDSGAAS